MAVVVNKDVPVQNITSAHLAKLFKGEVKKWPDGNNVLLVLHILRRARWPRYST